MGVRRSCFCFSLIAIGLGQLMLPARAAAQWYLDGAIGGNHSHNADVSVRQPTTGLALDFHDVPFESQSNYPRRYYVVRLGRLGQSGRLGWEVEQIHLKAVVDTSRSYAVTAADGTTLPDGGASPMNLVVQEYQMTHGVNLAVVNLVIRRPLGSSESPVALMFRAGAGASFPHGETTVNGGVVHHYEYGGPGAQGAAGVRVRVLPRIFAVAEYKLTYTRPTIDVAGGGEGWTTLVSHHLAVGFSLDLTR